MLEDTGNYPEGKSEVCKPDYEKQIKDQKERLQKTLNLKNALFDYTGMRGRIHGKLAEMIGELVQEERVIEHRVNKLIEQQASNQD